MSEDDFLKQIKYHKQRAILGQAFLTFTCFILALTSTTTLGVVWWLALTIFWIVDLLLYIRRKKDIK